MNELYSSRLLFTHDVKEEKNSNILLKSKVTHTEIKMYLYCYRSIEWKER